MEERRILRLPLKKEWYEMIESGNKTEEYREIVKYWISRCCENKQASFDDVINGLEPLREYDEALFSFGYTTKTMSFKIESITVGVGKKEWGAPDEPSFIIKLGKRLDVADDIKQESTDDKKEDIINIVNNVYAKTLGSQIEEIKKPVDVEIHIVDNSQKKVKTFDNVDAIINKYFTKKNWFAISRPQCIIDTAGHISSTDIKLNYHPEYPMVIYPAEYKISWNANDTQETFEKNVDKFLKEYSKGIYTIVIYKPNYIYKEGEYVKLGLFRIYTNDKTKNLF